MRVGLLDCCARRERPRCRRAAEQRDERATPHHSIASSARSRSASGTFKPRTLAVVRLMTKSNLVGCSTGMSAGFAPRKILSTISAARRFRLAKFGPYDIKPPASTYCRQARSQCQNDDAHAMHVQHRVAGDIDCICMSLERLKRGHDILALPDLRRNNLKAEPARYRLNLI